MILMTLGFTGFIGPTRTGRFSERLSNDDFKLNNNDINLLKTYLNTLKG